MARQAETPRGAESGRSRLARAREDDRRSSLGRELVDLRPGGGPPDPTVLIQKCLGGSTTRTPIPAPLATWRDKDRAVEPALMPASHSRSPWLADGRGASVSLENSRWSYAIVASASCA